MERSSTAASLSTIHNQYLDETAQRFESLRLPLSSDAVRIDMLVLAIKRWDRVLPR